MSNNSFSKNIYHSIYLLFDIKSDSDEEGAIENIKKTIKFSGENLWALVCAILIASVGLNINSTAVIIGAMLISPLMGPIVGIGLAIGIKDFDIMKLSLKNLLVSVSISIATSSIYFYLSPISQAQSELLSRTNPTIFDVLIAFSGGIAGMVTNSRKSKSNAIAGVAIATALMPPLCTAGYGLANGNMRFFFGAFYLFFINSVFICISTFCVVRFLKFKEKEFVDIKTNKRIKRYIAIFAILTMLPSTYTAWNVANQSIFESKATKFLNENFKFKETKLINQKLTFINTGKSTIEVTLIGEPLGPKVIDALKDKLSYYNLISTDLLINQSKNSWTHIEAQFNKMNENLKIDIIENLYKDNLESLKQKENKISLLEQKIKDEKKNFEKFKKKTLETNIDNIIKELKIYYPEIKEFSYSKANNKKVSDLKNNYYTLVVIKWSTKPKYPEYDKILKFMRLRTNENNLQIINQ